MKEQILSHLGAGHSWAGSIRYYKTVDSTNTEAKRLADKGAPHGTVLIADRQTAGRGRMGRSFHSPENAGIYMSLILRPDCKAVDLSHLTCAVGTAMCDAVEAVTATRPGIKWINDLVYNGRKLGGILTELSIGSEGNVNYAIVGIGINCNQAADEFPVEIADIATSVYQITGKTVDRAKLIAQMICHLHILDQGLFKAKAAWMKAYRMDCITLGKEVMLISGDEKRYGKALDVLDDGAMEVQFDNGEISIINSGEIQVRGLYGYC